MVCYAVPPYFLYHTLLSVLTLLYAGIKNIISILAHILSIKSTSRHTNSFSSSISLQIRILHNLHLSFSKMTFFTYTYFKLLFSNAPCITVTFSLLFIRRRRKFIIIEEKTVHIHNLFLQIMLFLIL